MDYWGGGGGGGKGYVGPPLKLLGGGGAAPPLPPLFLRLCNFGSIKQAGAYMRLKDGYVRG